MGEIKEVLKQVSALSYLGIFGISLLANVVIPIPEEITLLAIGYGVGIGVFSFFPTWGIVMSGLLISDSILFYFSKKGTRALVWTYEKYFSKLGLKNNEPFLRKHINWIIIVSRFLVQFRFLGPFLSGYFQIPFKRFIKFELIALICYVPLVLWIGSYFQNRIEAIIGGVGQVKNIIIIVIAALVLYLVMNFLKKKFADYLAHPSFDSLRKFFGYQNNNNHAKKRQQ